MSIISCELIGESSILSRHLSAWIAQLEKFKSPLCVTRSAWVRVPLHAFLTGYDVISYGLNSGEAHAT